MSQQKQLDINLQDPTEAVMLLGISDKNIKLIEEELKVQLITRGELIQIAGEEQNVEAARQLIIQLLLVIRKGININLRDVTT
ncbi:MAG: phosphate starvation-inducible protein PhoH, partial [Psychrobacillus sp.]